MAPGADYSPQEGNQGLTFPSQGQGLPMPPSSVGVPMRGPAAPPALPQTPQPDFASIAQAVQRQQQLANNPMYAMGQGFQGQNAQAGVMQSQMQLAQMIQQQRQSAMAEQGQHQQMLDRNIDMMMKVRQGIETQTLPPEFADTIGPILEQQHNQLFGPGSPYENQALPTPPGSIANMLKTGSVGGVTMKEAIDAQRDASPKDMDAALLITKRDPKDGITKAQQYLDARRKARLAAIEPTMTGHLTDLVAQMKTQTNGGVPTLADVVKAANAELTSHSDEEIQQAYGEPRAFVQKALVGALRADSPLLKGLDVQVGPGEPGKLGIGGSAAYLPRAIQEAGLKITPNDVRTLPISQQLALEDRAKVLEQKDLVEQAKQKGAALPLVAANAEKDVPLHRTDMYKGGSAVFNRHTALTVDPFMTQNELGLNDKNHVILDKEDTARVLSATALLSQAAKLVDVVKAQQDVPGGNLLQGVQQWAQTSLGIYNPGEAIRQYSSIRDGLLRLSQGAGSKGNFNPSQLALVGQMLPEAGLLNTTSRSQGLKRLETTVDIVQTYQQGMLRNIDPGAAVDKVRAAVRDLETDQAAQAKKLGGRPITNGTQHGTLLPGHSMPKGWRDE